MTPQEQQAAIVPNLADRCFDSSNAEDELFEAVNTIFGSRPLNQCLQPDFQWEAVDAWTDVYDLFVEVVRAPGRPPMTREQANKILDLGFSVIYETVGESGRAIDRDSIHDCSGRQGREGMYTKTHVDLLRKQVNELKAEIERLKR